jgi:hypothetical protein
MNLSNTSPNRIYVAQMTPAFWFNNFQNIYTKIKEPVEILFRTIKNENKNLIYETLAASKDVPFASIPLKCPVKEIFPDTFPLFINFPYKSPNFENILKGDPITNNALFHATIRVRFNSQSAALPKEEE